MKHAIPLCLAVVVGSPALAWDHTYGNSTQTWTFQGSEIISYSVTDPIEPEDPERLEVTLWNAQQGQTTASIEADLGVGSCPQTLAVAQGNSATTVTLVANLNATTLNGVTLEQCSRW